MKKVIWATVTNMFTLVL